MFPTPLRHTRRSTRILYAVALAASLLLWLLPLAALALTALRSMQDIHLGQYWSVPPLGQMQHNLLDNVRQIFATSPMWIYLRNSVLITVPAVAGAVLLASLSGFALAKFRLRGGGLLLGLFVSGNFVPFQILIIPVRQSMIWLGLYDQIVGLILFHIAFQVGFCTLFLRNYMQTVPDALLEAARLEGAGEWRLYWSVVLPLMRPALAALAVLEFTFIWNDYFWALVLTQSEQVQPVTLGLQSLHGYWVASWHLLSAGALLAAMPPVLLFFAMQRHFIAGLAMGAVKG
jgi:multiple sugar transport system permease protein